MITVVLPGPLAILAGTGREVRVDVSGAATIAAVLDALEARLPMLRGLIRDAETGARRPFLRYYADELDLSHEPPTTLLPRTVAAGSEPFIVLGSISGG